MVIKVLGTGCPKCEKLYNMATEIVNEMGLDATVEKITDIKEITMAGVMMTPALMVDDDVKLSGKLPSKAQLKEILS